MDCSCRKFLCSSIGKKVFLAFTGMALSLFLLVHVIGNLVLLGSSEKFNLYAFNLENLGLLLYLAEAGLAGIFILHILIAVKLSRENKAARPEPYYMQQNTGRSRRTWGSSNMLITGVAIFLFVIYHLKHFKFAESQMLSHDGRPMRDLAGVVVTEFRQWDEVAIYTVALILIAVHLRHGFRSLFDTLGLANTKWDPFFRCLTAAYVYGVMGAFILIPLWIYFGVKV